MMRALDLHTSGDGMKKTIFVLALALCCVGQTFAAKGYSYFRIGNAPDVATATTAGTVLMGGGTDGMPPSSGCASAAAMAIFW
jgi:hypothetical protein